MALIKCPECGREISDKAESCPGCGYPIRKNIVYEEKQVAEGVEFGTELFDCRGCGRPLPVGIDKCIYCDYEYNPENVLRDEISKENATETGILGRKNIICPNCGSRSVKILNDIPIKDKAVDLMVWGTVSPMTKAKHRKKMEYCCKLCGTKWK